MARPKSPRRPRRPRARVPADAVRANHAAALRSDLFAGRPTDRERTTTIAYLSGATEGPLTVVTPHGGLTGVDLVLYVQLCEWYLSGPVTTFTERGLQRRRLIATPTALARAVYGRPPGRQQLQELGLLPHTGAVGALQRLATTLLREGSVWTVPTPDGRGYEQVRLVRDTTLVQEVVWIDRMAATVVAEDWPADLDGTQVPVDPRARRIVAILLARGIERELQAGGVVPIPRDVVRLGLGYPSALRVAVHVLAHPPLPGHHPATRRVGLQALGAVVRPDAARDPSRYPGRFAQVVRRLAARLTAVDPIHTWAVVDNRTLVCVDRRAPRHPSGPQLLPVVAVAPADGS